MATDKSNRKEQRRLAGLSGYDPWGIKEDLEKSAAHPASPEDELDPPATPKPDDSEPPDTTGAGALQHWDMYRGLQEKALQLAKEGSEMLKKMGEMTESDSDMEPIQRKSLKMAKLAVEAAVRAQKEAFKKIGEFGSTVLGK